MSRTRFGLWWPVILYASVSVALLLFAFLPFNRRARAQSVRAARLSGELQARMAVIEQLPERQAELQTLMSNLSRFRAALAGTHEVDHLMARLRERAEASGLQMWILNPYVPDLIKIETGGDSLAKLEVAVLPVSFEYRGGFLDVARFLESEETRADFYRWTALSVTADPQSRAVQARGEFRLFLLPQTPLESAL